MLQLHLSAPSVWGKGRWYMISNACIEVNEIDKQKIMIKGQKINMADNNYVGKMMQAVYMQIFHNNVVNKCRE